MIHVGNIKHILDNGITHRNSQNSNPDFISIGDISLIDHRSNRTVIVDNGDFENSSSQTITLGDFIPFYFGVKMPMLYIMQGGGNAVQKATPPQDIIYIACSISKIIEAGNTYYFSDGHATTNLTTFHDATMTNSLTKIIAWDAIRAPYWGGSENLNLKRKKQAEFLVQGDLPVNTIIGYGCQNDDAKQFLINLGVSEKRIKVIPKAYY